MKYQLDLIAEFKTSSSRTQNTWWMEARPYPQSHALLRFWLTAWNSYKVKPTPHDRETSKHIWERGRKAMNLGYLGSYLSLGMKMMLTERERLSVEFLQWFVHQHSLGENIPWLFSERCHSFHFIKTQSFVFVWYPQNLSHFQHSVVDSENTQVTLSIPIHPHPPCFRGDLASASSS